MLKTRLQFDHPACTNHWPQPASLFARDRRQSRSRCSCQAVDRRSLLQLCLLETCSRSFPAAASDLKREYNAAASSYDALDAGLAANLLGFPKLRQKLLQHAQGDVLEVAVGTGINLSYYDSKVIRSYTGLDLSPQMLAQAHTKLETSSLQATGTLLEGNAEALPFRDGCFDSVVSTFSLCVFQNPVAVLEEMRRVLKPDGRLLLLEHSRSFWPLLSFYQDLSSQLVAAASKGCVWNQDLPALFRAAGVQEVVHESSLGGLITLAELKPCSRVVSLKGLV